jgi:hypothetical protein
MRFEAYRCSMCNGMTLVDAEKLAPSQSPPCPYCYVSREYPRTQEMIPVLRTVKYPDDFAPGIVILSEETEGLA